MELTPDLLGDFINIIIGDKRYINITNHYRIIEAIEKLQPPLWYVEKTQSDLYLWRRKDWEAEQDQRAILREKNRLLLDAIEERKAAFNAIRRGLCDLCGFSEELMDSPQVKKMALRALKKRRIESTSALFGIDLSTIPELEFEHVIYDERGKEDYRV